MEVSLTISQGSCTALVGPSGSGKSTLLALLSGLDRPTLGTVYFQGRDLTACSDVELARIRRRIGFIFQDFALIHSLPVWENVTYALVPRGITRAARFELARGLLGQLGLDDQWSKRPGELSGGEQQRVALALALAGKPEILVADEPTSSLDPQSAEALISIFRSFREGGNTLFFASHDPKLLELADTIHELRAGKLVATTG
jgi:ABC-type lipoprotein export system ATPase subunit